MDHNQEHPEGIEDRTKHHEEGQAAIIPVLEEHLHIGTSLVETGRVRISKKVVEEPYDAQVSVLKEEVSVEKKPINQFVEGEAPVTRKEGSTTIIPVLKEVIVKRLYLIEEIHITMHRTETTIPVHEQLRKEEVSVERVDETGTAE